MNEDVVLKQNLSKQEKNKRLHIDRLRELYKLCRKL